MKIRLTHLFGLLTLVGIWCALVSYEPWLGGATILFTAPAVLMFFVGLWLDTRRSKRSHNAPDSTSDGHPERTRGT